MCLIIMDTIYQRIGFKGLLNTVWKSMPLHAKLSLPYGLMVYKNFLSNSFNLEELIDYHTEKCLNSKFFRLLRPRYHKVKRILRDDYQIE